MDEAEGNKPDRMSEENTGVDREDVILVLKNVVDPEIYIDVWTLGLIYDLRIVDRDVKIVMTFTSPACPAGGFLVSQIRESILDLPEVDKVDIEVVFEPPWQPSEELKAMMGIAY